MADQLNLRWTVDIERPAAEVFDYLADMSRHGEWSPKPFRVEGLAPGPVSPGTAFVSYGAIPGDKEHRNEVEVTAVTAPVRLSFNAKEPNGDLFVNTFTVHPTGTGCRVEREWDLPKPMGVTRILFPLLLPTFIRPSVQRGLTKLKQNLESKSAPDAPR